MELVQKRTGTPTGWKTGAANVNESDMASTAVCLLRLAESPYRKTVGVTATEAAMTNRNSSRR